MSTTRFTVGAGAEADVRGAALHPICIPIAIPINDSSRIVAGHRNCNGWTQNLRRIDIVAARGDPGRILRLVVLVPRLLS